MPHSQKQPPHRQVRSRSALSVLIICAGTSSAASQETTPPQETTITAPVLIQSDASSGPNSATILTGEHAGGQLANGGGLGFLGNVSAKDAPFSLKSFTARLSEEQQARSVSDVLINDASVNTVFPRNSYRDVFTIRGFAYSNYDMYFNGMPGMAPKQRTVPQNFERIELLKGPSTFLNGMALNGAIGGTVNAVPKRAEHTPTRSLSLGYTSTAQPSIHLDLGQRFGAEEQFGVRTNLTFRKGELPVDDQEEELGSFTLGLDYDGERVRVASDISYQRAEYDSQDWGFGLANGAAVPDAPDGTTNLSQDWANFESKDTSVTLTGEFDITDHITSYAKLGYAETKTDGIIAFPTNLDGSGNFTVAANSFPSGGRHRYGETGVRTQFETGPISHNLVVAGSIWAMDLRSGFKSLGITGNSNLYAPSSISAASASAPLTVADLPVTARHRFSSLNAADTLGMFDDRLLVTLGARGQRMKSRNYASTTGNKTTSYNKTELSPALGVVWKATPDLSIYANRVEALQQGPTASRGTANAGETFAPSISTQVETGLKLERENWGGSISLFEITQPTGITDPATNIYAVDGEQRNRGAEINLHGRVFDGLRVLGSLSIMDAELKNTSGGTNDGNDPVGIPKWRAVVGADWQTPFVQDLSLSGRVIHTGSQFADAANTQKLDDWTRLDLGASYTVNRGDRQPVILRANIENVLGLDYWSSASTGRISGLSRGAPRTFLLTASMNF